MREAKSILEGKCRHTSNNLIISITVIEKTELQYDSSIYKVISELSISAFQYFSVMYVYLSVCLQVYMVIHFERHELET